MVSATRQGTAGRRPGRPAPSLVILGCMLLVLVSCGSPTPEGAAPASTSTLPSATAAPSPESNASLGAAFVPTPATPTRDVSVTPAATATATAPPVDPPPAEPPTPVPGPVDHTVRAGESLLGLATDYGVPMAAIQLANDLGDGITLWEGQVLTIPSPADWPESSPYWLLHLVKAGETLGAITAVYKVQLDALRAVNGLDGDLISIGQPLIIPLEVPVEAFMRAPTPVPPAGGSASGSGAAAGSVELPPAAPLPADMAAWPAALFQLINQARAAHGLYPLAYNDTLAWAAQLHAQDCASRGWCSHTGSDGASSATRIVRAGYPAAGTGECWVKISSVQGAFDFWYYETPPNDPHRRTLLSSYLTEVGIGIVAAEWGYYFVADFGRP